MKRINKSTVIISAGVVIAIIAAIIFIALRPASQKAISSYSEQTESPKSAIAKDIGNYISLHDKDDLDFSNSKQRSKAASFSKSKNFDGAVLHFKHLESGKKAKKKALKKELASLSAASKIFHNKELSVCAAVDISCDAQLISSLFDFSDGDSLLLTGTQDFSIGETQKKLRGIYNIFQKKGKKVSLWLEISPQSENTAEFFKLKYADRLVIACESGQEETSEFFEKLRLDMQNEKAEIIFSFDFSGEKNEEYVPNKALSQISAADKYDFTAGRIFESLGSIRSNFQNCFSAVEMYLNGEDANTLLKEVSIENYDGKTVQTNQYKAEIKVNSSPAFPLFLNEEEVQNTESGVVNLELSLKAGENSFVISQCGKSIVYKINVTFDGELIRSVYPNENMSASPEQKKQIKISAVSGAEVSIRVGSKKYSAKEAEYEDNGYSEYNAQIVFPKSETEINSIGKIVVTANYNGKTASLDGANVFYRKKSSSITKKQNEQSVPTLHAENFNPTVGDVSAQTVETTKASQTSPSVANEQQYTGNQMCVVTAAAADTWPGGTNDDKFVPYCSTLIAGTMDYITGTSQAFDSEKKETRTFYNLACGRRVPTKSVKLLAKTELGKNSVGVVSSSSENGELKIVLSQKWKVPVLFNYSPQEYYKANGRLFNVSQFTANTISFTFCHTADFSGSINTAGSAIVSSAAFSKDAKAETVTLSMPLKSSGKYYGYSSYFDESGNLVIIIHSKPNSISGAVILLDPGHGGSDSGAQGYNGAVKESQINLAEAIEVKNELERRGAKVYLTRTGETKLSLDERKAMIYSLKPDIFVSIHSDASSDSSEASGTSTFYFKPMSQALSNAIHNEMVATYKNDIYLSQSEYSAKVDRGSKYHPFSVTRVEDCPSVLIELGFVTNDTECAKLADPVNRKKLAVAIANGIEKYIAQN